MIWNGTFGLVSFHQLSQALVISHPAMLLIRTLSNAKTVETPFPGLMDPILVFACGVRVTPQITKSVRGCIVAEIGRLVGIVQTTNSNSFVNQVIRFYLQLCIFNLS